MIIDYIYIYFIFVYIDYKSKSKDSRSSPLHEDAQDGVTTSTEDTGPPLEADEDLETHKPRKKKKARKLEGNTHNTLLILIVM